MKKWSEEEIMGWIGEWVKFSGNEGNPAIEGLVEHIKARFHEAEIAAALGGARP